MKPPGRKEFIRGLLLFGAFVLPLAWIGTILAVTVHELVGHGGAAILSGGRLIRFTVALDGGGLAWTEGAESRLFVLSGGIASTLVFGSLFLALALLLRGPLLRVMLLIFAACCFQDGLPYGLWGAVFEGRIGDVSRILLLVDRPWLRPALIVGLAVLYAGSTFLTSLVGLRIFEDVLGPLSRARVILLAAAAVVLEGVAFATYDWNQIIEGADLTPVWGAVALQVAIGVALVLCARKDVTRVTVSARRWIISIATAWATLGVTIGTVLLCF